MINKHFPKTALAAILCSSSTISFAAQLEEIVVTAQKREQSMQDVPFSVAAVPGETLRNTGVTDLMNLQFISPSHAE